MCTLCSVCSVFSRTRTRVIYGRISSYSARLFIFFLHACENILHILHKVHKCPPDKALSDFQNCINMHFVQNL
nr:MAG TPA: hypothetical protein [Caudoviricetes sp.]